MTAPTPEKIERWEPDLSYFINGVRQEYPNGILSRCNDGAVGGTRKVRDLDADETCTDPSHNPPGMMVYEDGHYEHTCPRCGHVTRFVVRKPRL